MENRRRSENYFIIIILKEKADHHQATATEPEQLPHIQNRILLLFITNYY